MNKIFSILLLCCFSILAHAQQPANTKVDGPVFKFKDSNVHDFGTFAMGPQKIYNFEFTNVGNKPLVITGAMASCGCTTPEWPKEPILPGHNGTIKVTYNSAGHLGAFSKTVFVYSNAITGAPGVYDLHIIGTTTDPNEKKK